MKRSRWLRAAAVRVMTTCEGLGGWRRGELSAHLVLRGLGFWNCYFFKRVVYFAGLARDLLDSNCRWHCKVIRNEGGRMKWGVKLA